MQLNGIIMKPIIVTYSNESWIIDMPFGACYVCTKLGGYNINLISTKDIKLIARPKKQNI